MEKKKYIAPKVVVIEAEVEHHLLVNSKEDGKPLIPEVGNFEFIHEASGDDDPDEGDACAKRFHQFDAWADLPSY
jgi:hypothetical protein